MTIEAERATRTREQRAMELARQITDFYNSGGRGEDLAEALNRDHPTLQQLTMRGFYAWIKSIAARDSRWFDGRNQATKGFCDAVVAHEDQLRPWFPFV